MVRWALKGVGGALRLPCGSVPFEVPKHSIQTPAKIQKSGDTAGRHRERRPTHPRIVCERGFLSVAKHRSKMFGLPYLISLVCVCVEANDAVSANFQISMSEVPRLIRLPNKKRHYVGYGFAYDLAEYRKNAVTLLTLWLFLSSPTLAGHHEKATGRFLLAAFAAKGPT